MADAAVGGGTRSADGDRQQPAAGPARASAGADALCRFPRPAAVRGDRRVSRDPQTALARGGLGPVIAYSTRAIDGLRCW